jgi:hypothetical protein
MRTAYTTRNDRKSIPVHTDIRTPQTRGFVGRRTRGERQGRRWARRKGGRRAGRGIEGEEGLGRGRREGGRERDHTP